MVFSAFAAKCFEALIFQRMERAFSLVHDVLLQVLSTIKKWIPILVQLISILKHVLFGAMKNKSSCW